MISLIENSHPLSIADREAEAALVAAMVQPAVTSIQVRREGYDQMTARTPIVTGAGLELVDRDDVGGWWVRPTGALSTRAILFLHGGAYMLGSAMAYRGFVSQIAARTGVAAFALDYPLAPEHPFPAAHDAAAAGLVWLRTQGVEEVALVGDSAGGALVLACLARPRSDLPAISSAVVFSPWTDLALTGASFTNPKTYDPVFQPNMLANAASTYLAGADPRDGRASPLFAVPDALPPLLVQVGADELLLDDARRYAGRARERGGEVRLDVYEGLHHVFQRAVGQLEAARDALDDAAGFISAHWRRDEEKPLSTEPPGLEVEGTCS